jgi:hypothetical protein
MRLARRAARVLICAAVIQPPQGGMIMKRTIAAAAAAFLLATTGAFAQMTGQYRVEGENPDGSTYKGSAAVEKTGDTYRVTWNVAGERFVGTGIGSSEAIAIGYRSGSNTGIALLGKEGDRYVVVWTYLNGRKLGTEKWTRE